MNEITDWFESLFGRTNHKIIFEIENNFMKLNCNYSRTK